VSESVPIDSDKALLFGVCVVVCSSTPLLLQLLAAHAPSVVAKKPLCGGYTAQNAPHTALGYKGLWYSSGSDISCSKTSICTSISDEGSDTVRRCAVSP
jgi:hypothetical protein